MDGIYFLHMTLKITAFYPINENLKEKKIQTLEEKPSKFLVAAV